MDKKLAYFIFDYQWRIFKTMQMLLKKKIFRFSNICIHDKLHFIISMKPPEMHIHDLKWYTFRIQESGLMDIWEQITFFEIRRYYKNLKDTDDVRQPLGLRYFMISWFVLVIGCFLANVCIIFEIILK